MPAPKPPRKLVVYANPYFALDHNGMPCGAVRDTSDPRIRRWIGAKLSVRVNAGAMIKDVYEVSDQDNWFEFSGAKCEVADTRDNRRALNDGHLIPGDAYTAHRGSFAHKKIAFGDVAKALDDSRAAAVKAWQAQFHTTASPPFVIYEEENESLHETKAAAAPPAAPAPPKPSAEAPPHAPVWISDKPDTEAAPLSVSKPSAQVAPVKGA